MERTLLGISLVVGVLFSAGAVLAEVNVSCPAGYYPVCDDEVGCWCKQSSGGGSGHSNWVIIESMSSPIFQSISERGTFDLVIGELSERERDDIVRAIQRCAGVERR